MKLKADLVSGFEACVFLSSALIPLCTVMMKDRFMLPFWAGVCDTSAHMLKEYIRIDQYRKETDTVLATAAQDMGFFSTRSKEIMSRALSFQESSWLLAKKIPKLSYFDHHFPPY